MQGAGCNNKWSLARICNSCYILFGTDCNRAEFKAPITTEQSHGLQIRASLTQHPATLLNEQCQFLMVMLKY